MPVELGGEAKDEELPVYHAIMRPTTMIEMTVTVYDSDTLFLGFGFC